MASLLKQPSRTFHELKDSERAFSHNPPPATTPPSLSHTHTIKLSAESFLLAILQSRCGVSARWGVAHAKNKIMFSQHSPWLHPLIVNQISSFPRRGGQAGGGKAPRCRRRCERLPWSTPGIILISIFFHERRKSLFAQPNTVFGLDEDVLSAAPRSCSRLSPPTLSSRLLVFPWKWPHDASHARRCTSSNFHCTLTSRRMILWGISRVTTFPVVAGWLGNERWWEFTGRWFYKCRVYSGRPDLWSMKSTSVVQETVNVPNNEMKPPDPSCFFSTRKLVVRKWNSVEIVWNVLEWGEQLGKTLIPTIPHFTFWINFSPLSLLLFPFSLTERENDTHWPVH